MTIEMILLTNESVLVGEINSENEIFDEFTKVASKQDFEEFIMEKQGALKIVSDKEVYDGRGRKDMPYIDLSSAKHKNNFLEHSFFKNISDKTVNIEAYDNHNKKMKDEGDYQTSLSKLTRINPSQSLRFYSQAFVR